MRTTAAIALVPPPNVEPAGAGPAVHADRDTSPIAVEARWRREVIRRLADAYWCIATPGAFFSHVTAAVLLGLPLPLRVLSKAVAGEPCGGATAVATRDVDVAVLAPARAPRGRGTRGRQLSAPATKIETRAGMRVTDPATTWALLGEELTVDELIAVGDAIVHIPRGPRMVRGTRGLATIAELEAALSACRRKGAPKLRAALAKIRVGSASSAETDLRLALSRAGLPEPELDFDVIDLDGTVIGFTEFAYPEWRVLIEYEGDHHRVDRAQWYRDIEKHAACARLGWTVRRLTAKHLYPDRAPAVARVREALTAAGWRP